MVKVQIKRCLDVELPKYHTVDSAGFDISAGEDKVIGPNQVQNIRTGLIIQAPHGHFLLISARSSLAAKKGLKLANGVGIVDRDYAGPNDEIFLALHNFTDKDVEIKKGERLAQGIFIASEQIEWSEVSQLTATDRGGHGSTGGYL